MNTEIRKLRIDAVAGHDWSWTDAVTGEHGTLQRDRQELSVGDTILVEMQRARASWRPVRWIEPTLGPSKEPMKTRRKHRAPKPLGPGTLRIVRQNIDPRSSADRDSHRTVKPRPAVVLSHEPATGLVEIAYVYGTNTARVREGLARRIKDWKAAGLHKPAAMSGEIDVRLADDLGPVIGQLTELDRRRLLR